MSKSFQLGDQTYRQLGSRRVTLIGNSALWLGSDHLLLISSSRLSERYRRFYLREIQSILLRQKRGFTTGRLVIEGLLMAFALAAAVIYWRSFPAFSIFAVALVAGFILMKSRGPTCVCHISTDVDTVHIPSLYRVNSAERVLAELAPLIYASQTQPPPSEPKVDET